MSSDTKSRKYDNITAIDLLHQVSSMYSGTKKPHDYGTGETYTSTEMHLVKCISDHPGITVTELAYDYAKTKGAISQILKKLIEKLAVCSLGMYLVHPAVNFLLSAIGLHALTFMPLFCVPLCGLLVFGISFVIVVYMKKCPLLNKMV